MIERGHQYATQSKSSRNRIAQLSESFIREGSTILTHGFSRAVLAILLRANSQGKRFTVIVTEARPDDIGYVTAKRLHDANIPINLITDAAVAHYMDRIDLVLVGAEGIVENGGIINKTGTHQLSIVAKALNKPFYVAAESFKFMRFYPLNQRDLTTLKSEENKFNYCKECAPQDIKNIKVINPSNDYTPPNYITLLFTELGVLTPSAVSDELIKLYY